MTTILKNIIEISCHYGKDKEYVIAGGGNTSYKDEKYIWVKASGIALDGITEDGFVCLTREALEIISEKKYSSDTALRETEVKTDMEKAIVSPSGRRPSVESSLHNLINYTYVVHTHPTIINSLLCSKDPEKTITKMFGNEMLYIEYTDPGYILFSKVLERITIYRKNKGCDPKIIFLENHGVFVSANSIDEIKTLYSSVEKSITKEFVSKLTEIKISTFNTELAELYTSISGSSEFYLTASSKLIKQFTENETTFSNIAKAFTPDHIVYCKARYLFISTEDKEDVKRSLTNFKSQYGYFPRIIGIKGKGIFIAGSNEKQANIILELMLNMMKISYYAQLFGGSKPMTEAQISFIENWEAENYRKSMSK